MFLPRPFGLLNIDKPAGVTSRDVVNRVQRLFKKVKVGHAGTLDPLATGVLVVCIGPATRLVERLQAGVKEYRARFRFGVRSDTDDVTGNVLPAVNAQPFSRDELERLLPEFIGEISQTPPRFSAVHVEGQRAYDLARAGKTVTLTPRNVTVTRLEIVSFDYPEGEFLIECGSGTYIRSIGRDLGERLGCGAVMTELTRTRVGPFMLESAVPIDTVTRDTIDTLIIPPTEAVAELPRFICDDESALALVQGKSIDANAAIADSGELAIVSESGDLYGLGHIDAASGRMQPTMMFLRL